MNPRLVSRCAFALLVVATTACASPPGPADADFLAAKAAFERNDARKLAALAPALAGHLLEPYVQYWQLKLAIDTTEPGAVHAFLARHTGTPLADQLRFDWLKSLAWRGQWSAFGNDYAFVSGEDTELACYALQYRRQHDGDAALALARQYWFSGRTTPDACEPLFAALFAKGALTSDDRRARMRLASEAGNIRLAQSLGAVLSATDRIEERAFARVDRDAASALAKGEFAWKQLSGRELALYALERAARRDPVAARAAWVKWRVQLPEADRLYGNSRLALHASRQHVADAHVFWREAASAPLGEEQHAWRVRAALRAQAWRDVRAAIDTMPAAQKEDAAWRYWRARSLAVLGQRDEAKAIYATLAKEFHFYGLLAAEALGTTVDPVSRPLVPTAEALAAFGAKSAVRRAVKLAELDMRLEMIREWLAVIRPLDDESLLVAAEYGRRAALYDRAINTAERTTSRHDFALRYLMPHRDHFEAASREHDVDLALLFAIARQESRFVPDIVSSAGAQGLMQLMPATARWVARQLGQSDYRAAHITALDTNTRFGAYYFRYWLERLDSQPALAAAAYNAGPARAQAWRPVTPLEGAAWVETIPFNETRDYVKKVLANAMFYSRALGQPAVALSTRLGIVTPRPAGAPTATTGGVVTTAN